MKGVNVAYIAPGSIIRLIQGCPLNDTYENTVLFDSASAQQTYFSGLTHLDFSNQSYQRWDKGSLKLEDAPDDLIGYNYMMFQNTPFSTRWYYAFITDVQYINNTTAEVSYTIDVMQTWHFDYALHDCFIERQHAESDNMYENLVPEDLDLGDNYVSVSQSAFDMNTLYLGILATCDINGDKQTSGVTHNNYYSGLNVIAGVPISDVSTVNSLIGNLVESGDESSIVAMYEYPSFMGDAATWYGSQSHAVTRVLSLGGSTYYPRNNKLYTYPYTYLLVSNNSGSTATYHWEDFTYGETQQVVFNVAGMHVPSPRALCYPLNHRGIPSDFDSGVMYDSFPQLAWTGDVFQAWYAQSENSARMGVLTTALNNMFTGMMIGAGTGGLAGVPGATVGAAVGAIGGAALGTASTLAKQMDLANTPSPSYGQTSVNSLNAAMSRCQFNFYQMTVKREFAEIIDDYFTMYGYAQHKVATPNRAARTRWTYVKTIGSDVSGPIPKKDLDKINQIFDAGVRFWKNPSEIGNYSLGNPPLT